MSHFKPSQKFIHLGEKYTKVQTLVGGTDAMREAGTVYLPKEPAEADANYKARLIRAVLFPAYSRTIKSSVGKAFAKPMQVKANDQLMPLVDNADAAGTSLETFAKELLEDAINYGITYLLTDYPVIDPNGTLADERVLGAFPYFVNIKATSVLDLRVGYVDGIAQLTYFKFIENVTEGSDTIEQVKEFTLENGIVTYNIYRKDPKNHQEFLYDTGVLMGLDFIPITPVYGNKTANYTGEPTLYDLAELNIAHWQTFSDYRNIVHAVSCPILVLKGVHETVDENGYKQEVVISPNSAMRVPAEGDVKWVEVSGGSITAAKDALDDLESKMAVMGLELTVPRATAETATGRILDAAESNSLLKSIATDLEWAIYSAFCFAGQYIGVDGTPTEVEINTDYTVSLAGDMTTVMDMYREGLLSAKEVIQEAKNRQMLGDATVGKEPDPKPEVVVAPVVPAPETPTI